MGRLTSTSRGAFLAGAGGLAGVVALPSFATAVIAPPLGGTVTIGVAGPFSGDDAHLGEQMANGVRAATDDANAFRGTLDRAYAMRTFDDQNAIASGMVNAEFAADDPTVVAIVGHLSGRITEAALPTYAKDGMPIICPASTYDRLTTHGFGNILRLPTKDSVEGQLAARYITQNTKPTSTVVLAQDGDYGPDVSDGFVAQMRGDKVPVSSVVISWEKPKFAEAVAATLAKAPAAVYLAGLTKDMGPVVPLLRAAGYAGRLFASQGFFDPLTIVRYANDVEGLIISCSMPPLQLAPGAYRIRSDYERTYGPFSPLAAFAYAAAQIIIAVVRRTNASDRIAVLRALTASPIFDTVVGSFAFSNTGDPQNPQAYFYAVKDGAWKYAGSAFPSSFVVK